MEELEKKDQEQPENPERRSFITKAALAVPAFIAMRGIAGAATTPTEAITTGAYAPASPSPANPSCPLAESNLLSLKGPADLVFNGGKLWVAETRGYRIRSVTVGENFAPDEHINAGSKPGQFDFPLGITALPDGLLAIADTWNHRVQLLDGMGNQNGFIGGWAHRGTPASSYSPAPGYEDGLYHAPEGLSSLAFQGRSLVAVADSRNHRVQIMERQADTTWRAAFMVGSLGEKDDNLKLPSGCALFEMNGALGLAVVDRGHSRAGGTGRVKVYLPATSGKLAGKVLLYAYDLALGSELNDPRRITAFQNAGRTLLAVTGIIGKGSAQKSRLGIFDAADGKAITHSDLLTADGVANPLGLAICPGGCHVAVAHAGKVPTKTETGKDGLIQIVRLKV